MTFLPILERELSVWARNRGTYWGRFAVALCGMVVCLPQLGWMGWFGSQPTIGKHVFDGLVAAGFLLGCCGCFLTADAISVERREGTLPLLLLTRVKPFDIVMGKLGSTGLASLCSVVALLPLLMLPVLAGGVTGGEVFRKGLACLNTLFFALAVGLYQSATARERFRAGATAGLMLAAFLFLPFVMYLLALEHFPLVAASPLISVISA